MERTYENEAKISEMLDKVAPDRLTLRNEDFRKLFGCSEGVAYKMMREAKSVSDIANAKGLVTKTDFLRWYFRSEAIMC